MLKGIPTLLSPEFLKVLAEMGHGDEIVIADANFPAASHAQRLIRCDGHSATDVLDAVLTLMPLDAFAEKPAALMQKVPGHNIETPIWDRFREIIVEKTGFEDPFEMVERFAFYERSKKAFAIVATGETALYGNIILKKGVL